MLRRFCLLSLLLLMCFGAFSVSAAVGDDPKGFLEFARDYFDSDVAHALPETAPEDVDTYNNSDNGIAVMSVVTDNIDNGSLTMTMYGNNQHKDITDTPCYSNSVTTSSAINSVRTRTFNTSGTLDQARSYVDSVIITRTAESNEPLFKKGTIFDLSLTNLQCYWDYSRTVDSSGKTVVTDCTHINYGWGRLVVYDDIGNAHVVDCDTIDFVWSDDGKSYSVMLTTTALPVNVYKLEIQYFTDLISTFGIPQNAVDPAFDGREGSLGTAVTYIMHHTVGFYNSVLYINEHEETTGLLQSIIASVNNIKDGIINLPSKIANFVIDGIMSLFVPRDGFFDEYLDSFSVLLEDRFGFVYTSFSYLVDLYNEVINNYSGNDSSITFPSFDFTFGDSVFTFGGWDIDVVPEGFEGLVDILKTVVNIVCTVYMCFVGWHYMERLFGGANST